MDPYGLARQKLEIFLLQLVPILAVDVDGVDVVGEKSEKGF